MNSLCFQGSRWTLQAIDMNGEVGGFHIQPDQMQAINPVLIILFIPMFEGFLYPLLSKCNLLTKPLQRMVSHANAIFLVLKRLWIFIVDDFSA